MNLKNKNLKSKNLKSKKFSLAENLKKSRNQQKSRNRIKFQEKEKVRLQSYRIMKNLSKSLNHLLGIA